MANLKNSHAFNYNNLRRANSASFNLSIQFYLYYLHTLSLNKIQILTFFRYLSKEEEMILWPILRKPCIGVLKYFRLRRTFKWWLKATLGPDFSTKLTDSFGSKEIFGYYRLRNKRRGTLINFWKILKKKKWKMTAMPRLI